MNSRLPYELIVTDFDGTLILDGRQENVAADLVTELVAMRAAGARWVIATGRGLNDLLHPLSQLSLPIAPDAVVVDDLRVYVLRGQTYTPMVAYNDFRRQHREVRWSRFEARLNRFRDDCVQDGAAVWHPETAPWGLEVGDELVLALFAEKFACQFADAADLILARNGAWAVPAVRGDDKGGAVGALRALWGIAATRTLVAGDDLNDLSMMVREVAGRWVAPANAVGEVRRRVLGAAEGYLAREVGSAGVAEGLQVGNGANAQRTASFGR